MRKVFLILVSAITVLSSFPLPHAAAVIDPTGGWALESVGSLSDTVASVAVAAIGEKVGFAYTFTTSHKVGFTIRAIDGTYTDKSADVGLANSQGGLQLVGLAGNHWVIAGETGTSAVFTVTSADDGATWATPVTHAIGSFTLQAATDLQVVGGNVVLMVAIASGGTPQGCALRFSGDNGATWNPGFNINDNKGSPVVAGTSTTRCDGGGQLEPSTASLYTKAYMSDSGGANKGVHMASGGTGFWDVPWYPGTCSDGTTLPTYPTTCSVTRTDGATSNLFLAASTANTVPFNQLGLAHHSTTGAMLAYYTDATGTPVRDFIPSTDVIIDAAPAKRDPADTFTPMGTCTATTGGGADTTNHVALDGNSAGQYVLAYECATPAAFKVMYSTIASRAWTTTYTTGAVPNMANVRVLATPSFFYVTYDDTLHGGQLSVIRASTPTSVEVGHHITVTGLSGFDVDPFDGAMIARYTGTSNQFVKTYDPTSLTQLGSNTNGCTMSDGVLAHQRQSGSLYVGYMDCIAQATSNILAIRSQLLGNPDQSKTVCESRSFCNFFIQQDSKIGVQCPGDSTSSSFPSNGAQIGNLASVPIDYTTGGFSDASAQDLVGFAYYNGVTGNLGLFVDKLVNEGGDVSCLLEVPFTTPGTTAQICSWRNPATGIDYIAGASQAGGSKVWTVSVNPNFKGIFLQAPEVQLSVWKNLPTPFDKLQAVSCGGTDIVVTTTAGQTSRLRVTTPALPIIWGPIATSNTARGNAFSQDQKWAAVLSGTNILLLNGTSGATVRTIPDPVTTDFVAIRLDDTGQWLYYVTKTSIDNLDVHGSTTMISVPVGTRCDIHGLNCRQTGPDGSNATVVTTSGGSSGGGIFGSPASYDFSGAGDPIRGGVVLTVLWVLGMAGVGATLTDSDKASAKIWGAGLGAVLGFGMLVAFGNVPPVITFLLVLLCAVIVGFKVRSSRAGGG